jgi:hypothetical protein
VSGLMIFMKNLACQMSDQKQRKQVELEYRVRNMPMISRISVEGNGVIHMNMLPGSYCSQAPPKPTQSHSPNQIKTYKSLCT